MCVRVHVCLRARVCVRAIFLRFVAVLITTEVTHAKLQEKCVGKTNNSAVNEKTVKVNFKHILISRQAH